MDNPFHDLRALFEQLGLPCEFADIEGFAAAHRRLPRVLALHEAPFWTPAQAAFLFDGLAADADWAEVIDRLDTLLR
jgi:hypothetical protein